MNVENLLLKLAQNASVGYYRKFSDNYNISERMLTTHTSYGIIIDDVQIYFSNFKNTIDDPVDTYWTSLITIDGVSVLSVSPKRKTKWEFHSYELELYLFDKVQELCRRMTEYEKQQDAMDLAKRAAALTKQDELKARFHVT